MTPCHPRNGTASHSPGCRSSTRGRARRPRLRQRSPGPGSRSPCAAAPREEEHDDERRRRARPRRRRNTRSIDVGEALQERPGQPRVELLDERRVVDRAGPPLQAAAPEQLQRRRVGRVRRHRRVAQRRLEVGVVDRRRERIRRSCPPRCRTAPTGTPRCRACRPSAGRTSPTTSPRPCPAAAPRSARPGPAVCMLQPSPRPKISTYSVDHDQRGVGVDPAEQQHAERQQHRADDREDLVPAGAGDDLAGQRPSRS